MLVDLLVLVLILGFFVWVAQRVLAEPFRSIALGIAVLILLIWLLRFSGILMPGRY